jgi:hypothetical protein
MNLKIKQMIREGKFILLSPVALGDLIVFLIQNLPDPTTTHFFC